MSKKQLSEDEVKAIAAMIHKVYPEAKFALVNFDYTTKEIYCAGSGDPKELEALLDALCKSILFEKTSKNG
jgi:hypothetical protein